MERRGAEAKKFKPVMWCGSEESLYRSRETTAHWYGPITSVVTAALTETVK
jgi:hypothetical protein